MTRTCLSALLLAALLATAGCGHIKTPALAFTDDGEYLPAEHGDGLVVAPNPLIPDVPMPVGFRAVASQSHWQFDGRVRMVHHVYQGQARQGDAVDFYSRTLPSNGWELLDMQTVGESMLLRYTKGVESLNVTVYHCWGVSTVTIVIEDR